MWTNEKSRKTCEGEYKLKCNEPSMYCGMLFTLSLSVLGINHPVISPGPTPNSLYRQPFGQHRTRSMISVELSVLYNSLKNCQCRTVEQILWKSRSLPSRSTISLSSWSITQSEAYSCVLYGIGLGIFCCSFVKDHKTNRMTTMEHRCRVCSFEVLLKLL